MIKRLMILSFFAMVIYNMTFAEDRLSISNIEITPGETIDVSISLENANPYVAFQFDLDLPNGISVFSVSANPDRIPASTTISMERLSTGSYRFIAAAMQLEPITGNSGKIINLSMYASSSAEKGELTGYFRNVKLSKADATGPTYESFSFPVTVCSATVAAKDKSREYGDENPLFDYTVKAGTIDGDPVITCNATSSSVVGNYDIKIEKGTITNSSVKLVNGTLTVNKAPLIINGGTYTMKRGAPLPIFQASYEGFKNNETEDVLTTKPTLTTTATSESNPGTYDVTVSGAEAQNYAITYVKGKLTIEPGIYKLTYMVDGEVYKTIDVEYGATITPEAEPTKEGYTFSGWSEIPTTMPAKDVTVTGSFSINKYKLTYIVDGEVYKTFDVEYGATITPETEPTKEGHTFSGWSEIPETMPAHDVTVTGTFSINKYKLTYEVDGEVYKTFDVEYGTTITPEAAPTKEGYTFSGWSDIPTTMPAHDVTVTGTFSVNKYKLTYIVDGEVYKTYDVEYGATITPEEEPTKEGYTFSGWNEIPATMPAHDVTVTGSFSINKFKLTYEVDGEVYKTFDVEYGATITPETEPTKEGYTFSGWSEIPETMPAHDVTVTGTFTQETGIEQIMSDENGKAMIYTIDGKRVDNPKKGMNVIRMKDGTTRKVVVK